MTDLMLIFLIAILGYLLGRITIFGLRLGTSGILIVALIFGHFGFIVPSLVQNIGLATFVTSVGFIARPSFFRNFKKKALSFVLLGILIILTGSAICAAIISIGDVPTDLAVGMMSGALTSTPGLAAAIEATGSDMASVGYGIAYPFGVIGVVLFVQLVPKFLHLDIEGESKKLDASMIKEEEKPAAETKSLIQMDEFGLFAFSAAVVAGLLIAQINIPLPGGASFSLGTSGGPLLAGLVFGHFAHIGPVSISVPKSTLEVLREVGLGLFLMGAGTSAGQGFVEILMQYGALLFVLGAVMTVVPMLVGYLVARYIFKIDVLNALGSICGGMTSTPALGTLMSVTHSESVAVSYASTYPVALIMVVLCCEFIPMLF